MALPVIKINSTGGHDTQASGAGPTTALFGTAGVSAGDGLSVDLTTDAPDLSGVATDGSAVLFFNDATAGNKNFVKITNANNSTKIVTVANALGASLTKGWAIGGKRSAIGTTLSRKLFDNNSAAGDCQPGWIVEMESGHSETLSAALGIRCPGDTTDGPIIFRGAAGAGTLPLLTFSNNSGMISILASAVDVLVRDFELRNSNASKTASTAVSIANSQCLIRGIKINHQTDKVWKGIVPSVANTVVCECEIAYCASHGIDTNNTVFTMYNNYIHHNGGSGVNFGAATANMCVIGNIFYANTADGLTYGTTLTSVGSPSTFWGNIFDGNTGDGLEITGASTVLRPYVNGIVGNNVFSNNGGYGLNLPGSGMTSAVLAGLGFRLLNNNHYNNTGDTAHLCNLGALSVEENTVNINPAYVNASGGNFSSAALKELGYPLGGTNYVGKYSTTYQYPDIGVQAHTAAAGGLMINPGLSGGLR